MKICVQCGREFEPASNSQKLCSKECAKIKRQTKSISKYEKKCKSCGEVFFSSDPRKDFCNRKCKKDYCDYVDNSTLENPCISEKDRKELPTKEYIKEINFLLKDFGIDIEIPNFNTVAELDRWKHKVVYSNL